MKTHILVGEIAVRNFLEGDLKDFEKDILEDFNGDIISWDKETEEVSTLLEQLEGWLAFLELTEEDLEYLEENTKIEIL